MNKDTKIGKRMLEIEKEVLDIFSFGTLETEKILELEKEKEELQNKCSHSLIDDYDGKKICMICRKIIE